MVGQHVNNDAQPQALGIVTHRLELVAGAQLIVANGPVGGLVVVVPLAVAKELASAALAHNALVDGRGLHNRVAGILDLGQMLADGVERPRPGVQDNLIIAQASLGSRCAISHQTHEGNQNDRKNLFHIY